MPAQMKKSGRPTLANALTVFVILVACLPSTGATADISSNELVVHFGPNTTNFLVPTASLPINQMISDSSLAASLQALGALSGRRVFPSYTAADTLRVLETGETVQLPDLSQVVVLEFAQGTDLSEVLDVINQWSEVEHSEPVGEVPLNRTTQDPWFTNQKYLQNDPIRVDLGIATAWNDTTGASNLRVGIIDSGIRYTHEDFGSALGPGAKVVASHNFVTNSANPVFDPVEGHGTAVAGVIGALTDNTKNGQHIGVAGILGGWGYDYDSNTGHKGAALVSLNTFNPATGSNDIAALANAIVEGSDPQHYNCAILNMSLGQIPSRLGSTNSYLLEQAINFAARFNRILVASKGKDGTGDPVYPADFDSSIMIAVGSVDANGIRSPESHFGNGIDVVGEGGGSNRIVGVDSDTDYGGVFYGTSATAPQASGLAGLLLSVRPDLHPQDVEGIITRSADDLGVPGKDEDTGFGAMNAGRAMSFLKPPWSLQKDVAIGGAIVGSTPAYWQYFDLIGNRYVVRYDVRTTVTLPTGFVSMPFIWGRGTNASIGYTATDASHTNWQLGYCNVSAVTATTAELQTFVYRRVNPNTGLTDDYYPAAPANVRFTYTVLGQYPSPTAAITGPSILGYQQGGTWVATASGGNGSYTYEWRVRSSSSDPWSSIQGTGSSYSRTMANAGFQLQLHVQSAGLGAYAEMSIAYSGDATPPGQVTNLQTTNLGETSIRLNWTSPGDDGAVGTAAAYDLRYSHAQITSQNFALAIPVSIQPTPLAGGSAATYTFTGRDPCLMYWFALRARDEVNNWSLVSNSQVAGTSSSSGCGGDGGDEPPIFHQSGTDGTPGSTFRIGQGGMRFDVLLADDQTDMQVKVFNVQGRLVNSVANGGAVGWNRLEWRFDTESGGTVSPGIYFARLQAGGKTRLLRVLLLP